jgi:hypothetical protein
MKFAFYAYKTSISYALKSEDSMADLDEFMRRVNAMPKAPTSECECGRPKPAKFPTCWACKQEKDKEIAYSHGYVAGRRDASTLDAARVRQLLQLCHPDKHNGSPIANEITAWLLSMRK